MLRQGDVLMIRVKEIPEDAKQVKREGGHIVLAHGEATGHAHRVKERSAKLYEHEGTRWIRVVKVDTELVHEEHASITINPGLYEVRIQREYSPEEIRNVRD